MTPLIVWFRRDLRLDDNPMLAAAAATGRPLIPVFVADASVTGLGAAARWRMGQAVESFAQRLAGQGARLILRRGPALTALLDLARETGAQGVWWGRLYEPQTRDRDRLIKDTLRTQGIEARSFAGHTLVEPWELRPASGQFYKVFTPFWRALQGLGVAPPVPAPARLTPPAEWPGSEDLASWRLGAAMNRGAPVLARYAETGEVRAQDRLARFLAGPVARYATERDFPALPATSGLSENLTYGEIGPRRVWHAAPQGAGGETFRKELAWRDFAHHLMFHTPHLLTEAWRPEWAGFPWQGESDATETWRRARTGVTLVDAGLRQMYVTGTLHNRVRMVVASYLTKNLISHWKIGMDWFADCLTDWDPASNAMGWQWVAGSGPDAAPYFRVFNPDTQADKFDKSMAYRRTFIAEIAPHPGPEARAWFEAAPRAWGLEPGQPYPRPLIDPAQGRLRALAAYQAFRARAG